MTRLWRKYINKIPEPLRDKLIDLKLYLSARPPPRKFGKKAWAIGITLFVGVTALAVYLLEWYLSTLH